MNLRALTLAAAVAGLFGTAPAHAATFGGGAATGTYSCVAGTASFSVPAPVFVFNGAVGSWQLTGTTSCTGLSLLADTGGGTFDVQGPGVTCTGIGGVWTAVAGHLQLVVGGPCTVAGGSENVQFLVEGAIAAGTIAGAVVVAPTF